MTLSNLTLSNATLYPSFSPSITTYNATVTSTVSSVQFTSTASDTTASVLFNGQTVASGSQSPSIGLLTGFNRIGILVQSQDGLSSSYYYIDVYQLPISGVVSTLAGGGASGTASGFSNATGTAALFNAPDGIAVDTSGIVFVADSNNNKIRKITSAGVVSTFAGSGAASAVNATGAAATFNSPNHLTFDAAGNLYVADGDSLIRKITTGAVVTTLAGQVGTNTSNDATGTAATFWAPVGIAFNPISGNLFVSDYSAMLIRGINLTTTAVTTVAGKVNTSSYINGTGTAATFNNNYGIAVDGTTGNLYVADSFNNVIRKITSAGVVTTFAGTGASTPVTDGPATSATFYRPKALAVDYNGNIYVADIGNNMIRVISPAGIVTTLAGNGTASTVNGTGTAATFNAPIAITVDSSGNLYTADYSGHVIRKIQ